MSKTGKTTKILLALGMILIAASIVTAVIVTVSQRSAISKNAHVLVRMSALIPEVRSGAYDDRVDMDMPTLRVDGADFCAIIEVPARSVKLPVGARYESGPISRTPCRYTGSIYDGSLVIYGGDQAGQFDFSKTISIGDSVFVTDMTGARYAYRVTWAEFEKEITEEYLSSLEADLILVVKNTYSLDYTVVRCSRFS